MNIPDETYSLDLRDLNPRAVCDATKRIRELRYIAFMNAPGASVIGLVISGLNVFTLTAQGNGTPEKQLRAAVAGLRDDGVPWSERIKRVS